MIERANGGSSLEPCVVGDLEKTWDSEVSLCWSTTKQLPITRRWTRGEPLLISLERHGSAFRVSEQLNTVMNQNFTSKERESTTINAQNGHGPTIQSYESPSPSRSHYWSQRVCLISRRKTKTAPVSRTELVGYQDTEQAQARLFYHLSQWWTTTIWLSWLANIPLFDIVSLQMENDKSSEKESTDSRIRWGEVCGHYSCNNCVRKCLSTQARYFFCKEKFSTKNLLSLTITWIPKYRIPWHHRQLRVGSGVN